MVKDDLDSESTWATTSEKQQGIFYMHHPTDRIAHTMAFVTPLVGFFLYYLTGLLTYISHGIYQKTKCVICVIK